MVKSAALPNPDFSAIRAFGESHPDVYGGQWFVGSQLHVGLTVMKPHAAALRALLWDPASVTIRPVQFTTTEIAAVQAEIDQRVRDSGVTWHTLGAHIQVATAGLGPDGSALAYELHSTYGDRVRITVGGRSYPPDGVAVPTTAAPVATLEMPGLQLHALLDTADVATGRSFDGTVHLLNIGRKPIRFDTDQPLVAVVIDDAGRVAGNFSGLIRGTGWIVELDPGGAQEIRFIGGTAGGNGEQYSTPPDDYTVVVVVPVRNAPHGELVTSPVPLRVTRATAVVAG